MGEVGAETDLVFGELASLDRALDDDGYDARGSAWNGVLELDDEDVAELGGDCINILALDA